MNTEKKSFLYGAVPFLGLMILVVGVSGVLGPAITGTPGSDPITDAEGKLERIVRAFSDYRRDLGYWPGPGGSGKAAPATVCAYLGGCSGLFERERHGPSWYGPYLRNPVSPEGEATDFQVDPWGRGYRVYHFPPHTQLGGPHGARCVVSTGPNRILDTPLPGIAFGHPYGDDLVAVIHRD